MKVDKIMTLKVGMNEKDREDIKNCLNVVRWFIDVILKNDCESVVCVEYDDIINLNLEELEGVAHFLHYLQFADEII